MMPHIWVPKPGIYTPPPPKLELPARRKVERAFCMPGGGVSASRSNKPHAPAIPFSDTFVDTAGTSLLSHTPTISGTSWTRLSGSTSIWTIKPSGECGLSTPSNTAAGHTNQNTYLANGTSPASANYSVTAIIKVITQPLNGIHIYGRFVDSNHYYQVVWYPWAPELDLMDGATNLLGTTSSGVGASNGSSYTIALTMTGTTITVSFNGTTKITATSSHVSSTGQGAIGHEGNAAESDTAGYHFTSFVVQ